MVARAKKARDAGDGADVVVGRNCACHESDEFRVWGDLVAKHKSKAE
jgi:hypothetical protein